MLTASLASIVLTSQSHKFEERAKDWRNGAVIYQVFVDRFVPPASLESKRSLYPAGRLRTWDVTPKGTGWDESIKGHPHVIEFWGGDLTSLKTKLDYVKGLHADVLYLLPIFTSPTNHKYDTEDYHAIDPQYGTMNDFRGLIDDVHRRDMKIMLDGVFNHIGVTSPIFQEALKNPNSKNRDWFYFSKDYKEGYRGWAGVPTMPGLHLENSAVQNYFWKGQNSVVQRYLKMGIDGWRLDVAFELGPKLLKDITQAAHKAKPGSSVVGEISGYPSNWFDSVDGVFNFHAISLGTDMLRGKVSGGRVGRMYEDMVSDGGIENLLKSWLLTENHDTPRLAHLVPDFEMRKLVVALQMTLPGSPCVYYGAEVGMTGHGDPENRAPMRWDLVTPSNPDFVWTRDLLKIRKQMPSLRYGDFTALETDKLLGFVRSTNSLRETAIVLMNPTNETVKETFATRVGRMLSWGEMSDILTGEKVRSIGGILEIEMKPRSVKILSPIMFKTSGYSPYDRVD